MAIAALFSNPENPAEFYNFSFAHMANHRDIIRRIVEIDPTQQLTEYVLDPFDPTDMETWLAQHQEMHQEMDAILHISGYDLSVLDWRDGEQVAHWLAQNGNEHYIASSILGIG